MNKDVTETKLDKETIISIVESMGFYLDYDQWNVKDKEWMRFQLNDESIDEKGLRLIWYKDSTLQYAFKKAAEILFKAGQKKKIQSINELIDL